MRQVGVDDCRNGPDHDDRGERVHWLCFREEDLSETAKFRRDALFRAADDVKGNARTLGFPEAAPAANSLCRLLEHTPDIKRISIALIDQHVDAIRAIVREHGRKDIATIASVLTSRLRQVTEEFLLQENRHRPDYLESTVSPSPAPGEQF